MTTPDPGESLEAKVDRLSDSVDGLSGRVNLAPLWRWAVRVAVVLSLVASFSALSNVRAQESQRKDRTVASCQQQNRHDREYLISLAEASGASADTPQVKEVADNLRRRDCSTEGIDAYFKNAPPEPTCRHDGKGFCRSATTTTTTTAPA